MNDDELITALHAQLEVTYSQMRMATDQNLRERLCRAAADLQFHIKRMGELREREAGHTIKEFQRQLDEWGTPEHWGGERLDPFLVNLIDYAGIGSPTWGHLLRGFNTLDELLAATRDEILAVKGVGPRTLELLIAEFDRRGYRRPRRSARHA